jgi:succinate dehydrogenase / fumarate reductase cytochrome b subunit
MRFNREIYPGRGLGVWAFWLHRLSGLAIIFYLLMHILVISSIVGGQATFNSAMTFLKSPIFVLLEMGLIGCITLHGLNGIRVVLFDLGMGIKRQKEIFVGMAIAAAILTGIAFVVALPHIIG